MRVCERSVCVCVCVSVCVCVCESVCITISTRSEESKTWKN